MTHAKHALRIAKAEVKRISATFAVSALSISNCYLLFRHPTFTEMA